MQAAVPARAAHGCALGGFGEEIHRCISTRAAAVATALRRRRGWKRRPCGGGDVGGGGGGGDGGGGGGGGGDGDGVPAAMAAAVASVRGGDGTCNSGGVAATAAVMAATAAAGTAGTAATAANEVSAAAAIVEEADVRAGGDGGGAARREGVGRRGGRTRSHPRPRPCPRPRSLGQLAGACARANNIADERTREGRGGQGEEKASARACCWVRIAQARREAKGAARVRILAAYLIEDQITTCSGRPPHRQRRGGKGIAAGKAPCRSTSTDTCKAGHRGAVSGAVTQSEALREWWAKGRSTRH